MPTTACGATVCR
ncbi:hypothetical protein RDI58_032172 [Solanum bulbocastanum]|uniref:Uncharacterized protein n=1 Tax=Solanum bulbocastanum TaxID=147425 RepID=A0AAN8SRM1_SOLBU